MTMNDAADTTAQSDLAAGSTPTNAANTAASHWTPDTVLSTLPHPPESNTSTPLPFLHLLSRLKTTPREGWRRFGITTGESIADHMYRMGIITLLAPASLKQRGLDVSRCTAMALIHDMAESLVGDITPVDGVSKPEKSRREAETMGYLTSSLLGKVEGGTAGEEMRKVWREYEDGETLEAKFVHDVDKIELLLQAVEYERLHKGKVDLGEFTWVAGRVGLPEMQEWAKAIIAEREAFWKSVGKIAVTAEQKTDETKQGQLEEYYGKGEGPEGA